MTSAATSATGSNASVLDNINAQNAASKAQMAAQSTTGSKTADAKAKLTGDFNTFLTMLTTQLKHQDPLSPMDSTQFTNQLVSFSQVEQQININTNLQTLIGLQNSNQQAAAIGYIGQTVSVNGAELPLQDGQSYFSYTLASGAKTCTITIKDSQGNTVATNSGAEPGAGTHKLSWDGTDSSGKQSKDGKYTISVAAEDAQGKPVAATTTVYGRVTGVTSDASGTELSLGTVNIPLSSVASIVDPAALGSGSNSSSTN
jgi:flagellar basal-body rod modification protein FlgD